MNILLFTSSMIETDFVDYQSNASIKPNPSNQNFYYKLLNAFALNNKVFVVSHRPLIKGMFKNSSFCESTYKTDLAEYFYTSIKASRLYKVFKEKECVVKAAEKAIKIMESNDFIIVVDSLRVSLVRAAKKIARKYNAKIIGVLTDNPYNLTNSKIIYSKIVLHLSKKLDGYLSLSDGLSSLFNRNIPSYVFPGVILPNTYDKRANNLGEYLFFAGSLYERYGVKTLIDSFHKSKFNIKLLIAGNGPLGDYIQRISLEDNRIVFLNQLSFEDIAFYENNAVANINPRPLDLCLDNQSVPSKLFDYLSSDASLISTKFSILFNDFKNDVFWIDKDNEESFQEAITNCLNLDLSERKKHNLNRQIKATALYSYEAQSQKINNFLEKIKGE